MTKIVTLVYVIKKRKKKHLCIESTLKIDFASIVKQSMP